MKFFSMDFSFMVSMINLEFRLKYYILHGWDFFFFFLVNFGFLLTHVKLKGEMVTIWQWQTIKKGIG